MEIGIFILIGYAVIVTIIFIINMIKYKGNIMQAFFVTLGVTKETNQLIASMYFDRSESCPKDRTRAFMKELEKAYFSKAFSEPLVNISKYLTDFAKQRTNQMDLSIVNEELNNMIKKIRDKK